MKSPLTIYNETAKEFGITADKNVNIRQKVAFAEEQAAQMRQIANRLLFDIATTKFHLEEAKDRATKNAYQQKANQYENDLSQTSDSLTVVLQLVEELNNELKSDTAK